MSTQSTPALLGDLHSLILQEERVMVKFIFAMLCCKILERNRESQPSFDVPNTNPFVFDIHNMYYMVSGIYL